MGRASGPDFSKTERIRKVLAENPNGIWIRELARQADLPKSTVSLYLAKYMWNVVEDVFPVESRWIRFVRLRV